MVWSEKLTPDYILLLSDAEMLTRESEDFSLWELPYCTVLLDEDMEVKKIWFRGEQNLN